MFLIGTVKNIVKIGQLKPKTSQKNKSGQLKELEPTFGTQYAENHSFQTHA